MLVCLHTLDSGTQKPIDLVMFLPFQSFIVGAYQIGQAGGLEHMMPGRQFGTRVVLAKVLLRTYSRTWRLSLNR